MYAKLKAKFGALADWTAADPLRAGIAFIVCAVGLMALLCVATLARAADANLSWTLATQNTDGSTIPASGAGSLTGTRVEWGSCVGTAFGTAAGTVTVPTPATTHTVTGLGVATYCFRAFSRNSYGVESNPSGVVSKIVPAPTPNPPVLAVPVIAGMLQTPVYSVAANGKMSTFVGFVDVGATCSGPVLFTYRSKAFREVPRASVKLWGSTTLRLAAPCA